MIPPYFRPAVIVMVTDASAFFLPSAWLPPRPVTLKTYVPAFFPDDGQRAFHIFGARVPPP